MSEPCLCENSKIVWTRIARDGEPLAGGMKVLRKQCSDCGALSAQSLPMHQARPNTPDVDVAAVKRWVAADIERIKRRSMSLIKQGEIVTDRLRAQYDEYLRTEEWRVRRLKVLKRANWICEGCDEQPAVEVHHLSYEHLGEELLWELKAVCVACHAKCHPGKQRGTA